MRKNSIRQMIRTPVRTLLFALLIGVCAFLTTLGVNLFFFSQKTQKEAEQAFVTIGTVRQKASGIEMETYWEPFAGREMSYAVERYEPFLSDTELLLDGISYVHSPRQQPFYLAYTGDYVVRTSEMEMDESWKGNEVYNVIAEVQPVEDCVPDHPVKMQMKRVLYGKASEEALRFFWYWEFENPAPEPLYAGKTYIMSLCRGSGLWDGRSEEAEYPEGSEVWFPALDIEGTKYQADGRKLEDSEHEGVSRMELTEGFYDTDEGRRWLNIVEGLKICNYSIPVIPTEATSLLLYFYEEDAGVAEGRDITSEEYRQGKKVCLIEREFAMNNKKQIGDNIRLPLYCANYDWSAGQAYPLGLGSPVIEKIIDNEGNLYEPFEDSEYEIVGIYQVSGGSAEGTGDAAAKNGVIIPASSVKNSDEEHIVGYGPMKEHNTVFQIENGKIDEFLKIWNEEGTEQLEIQFRDHGYSNLEHSFRTTRRMSVLLLGTGAGSSIFILLLFCHMFVTKQKMRIVVERSLGVTKNQCRVSVISGIVCVVLLGSAAGCAAGAHFTEGTVKELNRESGYSTMFSSNKVSGAEGESPESVFREEGAYLLLPGGTGALFLLAAWMMAEGMTERLLSREPLELLGKIKRET